MQHSHLRFFFFFSLTLGACSGEGGRAASLLSGVRYDMTNWAVSSAALALRMAFLLSGCAMEMLMPLAGTSGLDHDVTLSLASCKCLVPR